MEGKINGWKFVQKRDAKTAQVLYDIEKKEKKHENLTAKEMHEIAKMRK